MNPSSSSLLFPSDNMQADMPGTRTASSSSVFSALNGFFPASPPLKVHSYSEPYATGQHYDGSQSEARTESQDTIMSKCVHVQDAYQKQSYQSTDVNQ